jgi:hypothetical protein
MKGLTGVEKNVILGVGLHPQSFQMENSLMLSHLKEKCVLMNLPSFEPSFLSSPFHTTHINKLQQGGKQ